jgi:hypothetical protein
MILSGVKFKNSRRVYRKINSPRFGFNLTRRRFGLFLIVDSFRGALDAPGGESFGEFLRVVAVLIGAPR